MNDNDEFYVLCPHLDARLNTLALVGFALITTAALFAHILIG